MRAHTLNTRFRASPAASNSLVEPLHVRSNSTDGIKHFEGHVKRAEFFIDAPTPAEAAIFQQAFRDMVDVVTYVQQNPNPQALARYFPPNSQGSVTAVFDTVRQMAQPGGWPNPPDGYRPSDLNELRLRHTRGLRTDLAESFNVSRQSRNQEIQVYDFGWNELYRRLRSDINCDCDIKKVNHKLHFLGTLILLEVL